MPLVSISDNQRLPLPDANWLANIQHGLPKGPPPLNVQKRGYLAFLGRIAPEKGPDRAIEIAKRTGMPLKMAAKVDPADQAYFDHVIRPQLDHPLIEFIGEIGDHEKRDFLGNAVALLFPIEWPEPFGLVMIEAMREGTPTIAWCRGSVPEVVDEGVTGFIVASIEEAVVAVHMAVDLDRKAVRQRFEERFTAALMASNYVAQYEHLSARLPTMTPHLCRVGYDLSTPLKPLAAAVKASRSPSSLKRSIS